MDKPIFCTLSEPEFAERRKTVLDSLREKVLSTARIPSGFAFEFPKDAGTSTEVHRAAQLEQQCCAFLNFRVDEAGERIRLEVTGSNEAMETIQDLFGIDAAMEATITCPHCRHSRLEAIPRDSCLHFYQCRNCGTVLRPKPGDCCIFCSFSSARCPSSQDGPG